MFLRQAPSRIIIALTEIESLARIEIPGRRPKDDKFPAPDARTCNCIARYFIAISIASVNYHVRNSRSVLSVRPFASALPIASTGIDVEPASTRTSVHAPHTWPCVQYLSASRAATFSARVSRAALVSSSIKAERAASMIDPSINHAGARFSDLPAAESRLASRDSRLAV